MKKNVQDLWIIEGKVYDMITFADKHPGGRQFLMLGRGRDSTELFKSVHAMSNTNFDLLLAKYEVKDYELAPGQSIDSMFDWSSNSQFWWELKDEVKKYFEEKMMHHKANWKFWIAASLGLCVTAQMAFWWIRYASMGLAFATGIFFGLSGFFLMHTGSHGGLSFNPSVNYGVTAAWCHYAWWHASLWLQHHVYGHHSYTGIHGKDPDVRNMVPFARKCPEQKPVPLSRHQGWLPFILLTIFPNQFVGQCIVYMVGLRRKKLFGMPLIFPEAPRLRDYLLNLLPALSSIALLIYPLVLHGKKFLPSLFMYWTGLGLAYWATVFPNHDTEGVLHQAQVIDELAKTKEDSNWLKRDWGVLQLVHSSNFRLPNFLAQVCGGMNYQIEHHLFPSIHPIHYPAISKIVRRLASKHQLPYCCYPTWFHALFSHWRLLSGLASAPKLGQTMKAA